MKIWPRTWLRQFAQRGDGYWSWHLTLTHNRRCRSRHPEFANWLLRTRCTRSRGHEGLHRAMIAPVQSSWTCWQ